MFNLFGNVVRNDTKALDLSEVSEKKRILLLVDVYDWCFFNIASRIKKQLTEFTFDILTIKDFYNNIVTFVVVHGLKSYDGSLGLAERLEKSIDIQADSFFVVSSDNYKTIQIHKNFDCPK